MGSNDGNLYEVTLSPYLIGKYEVKQAEWLKVMKNNPSYFKADNRPVEYVSCHDCQHFCQNTSLELPTEAQWEFACKAGSKGKYCFGDDYLKLDEYAWHYGNSNGETHPVGGKTPNAFGLYDMHGNVWEWCRCWWYIKKSVDLREPHFCCGGSWDDLRGDMRASLRSRAGSNIYYGSNVGFRVVYNLADTREVEKKILLKNFILENVEK